MGHNVHYVWTRLPYLFVLLAIAILGTILHETGHGATAIILGGEIHSVAIMPGIQLYPTVEFQLWNGWIAQIAYSALDSSWQQGLATIMGSGLTAFAGCGAIAVLLATRPKGLARFAWLSAAILFTWDGLAYSIFPTLGLKHWIVVGGSVAEPAIGATEMGIASPIYYAGLVLYAAASQGLILACLVQERSKG